MSKFRSYLGLFGCYMKVNMAASLEYRSSFAVQAFGMAISNASFVFFWWIAFQQMGGAIGGYSFNDVLFIWSVCPTAFGIAYVVFGNASQITRLIIQGELDTYLLQPKDALLSLLFARSRLTAWGDLFYGIILLAVSQSGNPKVWLPFALGSVLGAILCTAIVVTAHSCTFFLG
ncbi:MAG: ABC-2 family transporter protein, partial [Symbiobacteriaceae bacterium]|nr:ABC-2 family transporter protein [Symbiobacteriaceae bacterium]